MTVLVDTNVFFAFYSLRDIHHLDSLALITHLTEGKWGKGFITNHILDETLNVLKYKISPETSKAFLEAFIDKGIVNILYTGIDEEIKALEIFKENLDRKGFSYTDAVTAVVMRELKIDHLLSFDLRSFQGLAHNIIGPNYWNTLPNTERKRILGLIKKYRDLE